MSTEETHPQDPEQNGTEENVNTDEGQQNTDTSDDAPIDAPRAEASVDDLQEQVAALQEDVLRGQADIQNIRRRAERDVANAHKFGLDKFVGELLSVVDNLERSTAAIDPEVAAMKAVGEGVDLTLKGLIDVLHRFKVEQVDPKGETFDPEQHQAMTMVPNADVAANTVIEVFQKGYTLNGRLVRPAMVVVSKAP